MSDILDFTKDDILVAPAPVTRHSGGVVSEGGGHSIDSIMNELSEKFADSVSDVGDEISDWDTSTFGTNTEEKVCSIL